MPRPTVPLPWIALAGLAFALGGARVFAAPPPSAPGAPAPSPTVPPSSLPPPVHRIVGPIAPAVPAPRAGPPGTRMRFLPELGIEDEEGAEGPPPVAKDPPLFGPQAAGRQKVHIQTDRKIGRAKVVPVDDDTTVMILLGNPSVSSFQLTVKARVLVIWLDRKKVPNLDALASAVPGPTEAAGPVSKPKPTGAEAVAAPAKSGDLDSVIPEAVLGIYASGGVDLVTEDQAFRCDELYINPRTNQALLVQPRFDTKIAMQAGTENAHDVPIYVRAERARILAKGLASFDEAAVTTSRASDRIELRARVLTAEEYGQAQTGDPTFLGFTNKGTQHFSGQGIQARGERLTLFYASSAAFGGDKGLGDFPVRIRAFDIGSRSSLGKYAFLTLGGTSAGLDPWLDWSVTGGGYTKRGPAGLADLKFTPKDDRGRVRGFLVEDRSGHDRDGYEAGSGPRGFVELENQWDFAPKWRLDTEANWFSDQGVNNEFFESDAKNHKDRETYLRPRYLNGGFASTLTEGYHLREFQTETIQEPEVEAWSESLPLGRVGPLSLDLSTEAHGGFLRKQFADGAGEPDYSAYRVAAFERLYAPFLVGDVKISPFVGGDLRGYYQRNDGGADLTDGALTGGVSADVQIHKDFAAYGGPWALDGLRHVIDVDLSTYGRWLSGVGPQDVPQFDRIDTDVDRTEVALDVTQRLETRRPIGRIRRNALVAAARTRLSWWPDRIGPYGREGWGSFEWWGGAEVIPATAWIVTEGLSQFDPDELWRASLGGVYAPTDDFSIAVGIRGVRTKVLAPWFNVYYKWNEKWAGRASAFEDFEHDTLSNYRVGLLRFSEDHMWEIGLSTHDRGDDVSFYVNFSPSIGGLPTAPTFTPREDITWSP